MALFKIYKGEEELLTQIPMHEGYAYFCEDTGNLFIDISNSAGGRVQVNAYAASILKKDTKEIDIDDIFLTNMTATVAQGGTGQKTLTVNALLLGNGTDAVKMVSIEKGAIVTGDSTDGVSGLLGTGALFADVSGVPKFGTLPIKAGGTGATTATVARTNLDVYSKSETDNKIDEVTTVSYTATLAQANWVHSGDTYTYSYSNTNLKCGKNGNVPPIISWISNHDDYNKIDDAQATVGSGITFTASKAIEGDIEIVIIDVK